MSLGLILIIVGSIVAIGAFIINAYNDYKLHQGGTSSNFNMDNLLKNQFIARIAMGVGGLLFTIGLVLSFLKA